MAESVDDYPKLTPDTQIKLCAKEIDLSILGWFLGSLCTADVFIPALAVDRKVSLTLEGVRFDTAIKESGLVLLDNQVGA
jgi:hypothetical protein